MFQNFEPGNRLIAYKDDAYWTYHYDNQEEVAELAGEEKRELFQLNKKMQHDRGVRTLKNLSHRYSELALDSQKPDVIAVGGTELSKFLRFFSPSRATTASKRSKTSRKYRGKIADYNSSIEE
jgi:hypothetical protein